MAIAEDDIEKVRAAVSIVDVIQPHVALRRVGRNWIGLCPFHAEKTGSFNVREQTQRYHCFGCGASGDAFRFVQEVDHVDFVSAVERLAAKAGIQLTYTSSGERRDRSRRAQLTEAMDKVVEWYHDRLLHAPDAREARDYLRSRGLAGEIARQYKLGWAPDQWDAMARSVSVPADVLATLGLAFTNRAERVQDAFRARVLFPIFSADGAPVAFGGRVLPGSTDPAKYKNSQETPLYSKSKVLYGLNWSKAEIVKENQVIVCEGYTDVIGFHRAGLKRAVATCGTALTEEHVRILKRYGSRVVLAFDADEAGQGAAARFYEWEEKHQVEVSVAAFPPGRDPADMATTDPDGLRAAVAAAKPFLGFRLERTLGAARPRSPEQRARLAEQAMAVVNEHPNTNVRKLYAGEIALRLDIPMNDLVAVATRGGRRPVTIRPPIPRRAASETKEFVAIALLVQRWDEFAPWVVEGLFADDVNLRVVRALAATSGNLEKSLEMADPEARAVLERAAVLDVDDLDPETEARALLDAAVRHELARRVREVDPQRIREDSEVRVLLERVNEPDPASADVSRLLAWLDRRTGADLDHEGLDEELG
jgi:DNA primase